MKLITCEHCAVVLNADHLHFPPGYDEETDKYYRPFVDCPVCDQPIYEDEI